MKRALFDTVTVLPFASGNVVDRIGYESAVLAVTVEASQTATIKVETADSTAGPYEPVKDSRIFVDNPVNEDGEAVIENEAEAQAVANLDIDLIGCKAEYVNVANAIYIETINFLTRISARYSRLIAEPVAKLAGEVIDHAEKANSIYPSDDQRRQLRKAHLLEARASLMALDVRLTHCYLIMTQNPQGCFTTPSGKSVDAKKATERLDKMAQKLGELIDKENDLLQGMIGTVNRKA